MKTLNLKYRMIKTLCFSMILIILSSCGKRNTESDKPIISVSILPQKYFVEKITGNRFKINVLIPPGANEESYDPSPKQIADLLNSAIYFRIGYIEFEKTWIHDFLTDHPKLKVTDMSAGLPVIEAGTDKNKKEWIDPHIWMSPEFVKKIALNTFNALVSIDTKNESLYKENYSKFSDEIDSVETAIRMKLQDIQQKNFIIYHPALTYYAADFGLNQLPLEREGKSPSANYLRTIIETAKKENIKVILIQKQFDASKAEVIAREINGQVIRIDPLDYNWERQILEITDKLANALKKSDER